MLRFYKKIFIGFIISIIPVLLIVIRYLIIDPYNDLPIHYQKDITYIFQSLGDQTTKKILSSQKKINCFIFGSSKSLSFKAIDCKKKLFKNNKTLHPYHYANWGESIGGIYKKLLFLNSENLQLKYIFILLDGNLSFRGNGNAHDFDHYMISGISPISYYYKHFSEFINPTSYYFNENIRILLNQKNDASYYYRCHFDTKFNDLYYNKKLIKNKNQKKQLSKIKNTLVKELLRNRGKSNYFKRQISTNEKNILKKIKMLLTKSNTKYIFILTPIKNRFKLNNYDFEFLEKLFPNKIIDASGNNLLTEKNLLFIDNIHYFSIINEKIMDSVKTKMKNEKVL